MLCEQTFWKTRKVSQKNTRVIYKTIKAGIQYNTGAIFRQNWCKKNVPEIGYGRIYKQKLFLPNIWGSFFWKLR